MRGIMLTACIIAGLCLSVYGQKDYRIFFKAGMIDPVNKTLPLEKESALQATQTFNGYYYVLLQFEHIPTGVEREELATSGVELLQYLPNYAYLAKISQKTDINGLEVRAVLPIEPEQKMSGLVSGGIYPAHAIHPDGIALQAIPFPSIPTSLLFDELQNEGYQPLSEKEDLITLRLPTDQIANLASHPAIMYIETADSDPIQEGIRGRSLHGVNKMSQAPGLGYDGTGVSIAIGDDGSVNHEDFKGRLFDHTTYDFGNHGDMTAGLAIGSGNLNPMGAGMATGANLHLFGIDNYIHLHNAAQHLEDYGTVITSTSYGEECGGEYTSSTQSLDQQVYENNELLHFFSAGNSSNISCSATYPNIQSSEGHFYSNITGGRKAGKNVLAIGNLEYDDQLRNSSSRGPAEDGRIKPDLCAQGQGNYTTDAYNDYRYGGGTSAAAPVAAGSAAILYQVYKEHNNNEIPSSGLIKAIMLNTATDLGRPGPDFDYGWGRIDAAKAMDVIKDEQYQEGTIDQSELNHHDLIVPDNLAELKVMVYWLDEAASPLAGKALVNDLDIELEAPNGTIYRPWVLDTDAHIDSLTAPAVRGEDHLNNMEQVSIVNPNAGTYKVKVKGNIIPQAAQSYHLVYYFQKDEIAVKYPRGGEGFVPGEYQVVRWDAFGNHTPFRLEYSLDGMNSWIPIADNIPADQRHFDWNVPADIFGRAFIRISRNEEVGISEAHFNILAQPDFDFEFVDDLNAKITWQAIPGADRYDVFTLGDKYMEIIDSTTSTELNISINLEERKWYSVRARKKNSLIGRRSIAKEYQQMACEVNLNLAIQLDLYPQETSWNITDEEGQILASGGPYNNVIGGTLLQIEKCLPYGCYEFSIFDTHGDGIEDGYYTLTDEHGTLLANGTQFTDKESHTFCVEDDPNALSLEFESVEHLSCNGGSDGRIEVAAQGGTGNYSFSWNNGSNSNEINDLSAGIYSVTVNDGNNTASLSIGLNEPEALSLEANISETSCGEANGGIEIEVGGGTAPYEYEWSNNEAGTNLYDLAAGVYTLTITDEAGCTLVRDITVENSEGFELDFSIIDVSCFGGNDGFIEIFPNGGTAPFTIEWANGQNNTVLESITAGDYDVTVTDREGCIATENVVVLENAPIEVEVESTNVTDDNNGTINLTIDGGIPPYSFVWSNGATTQNLSDLEAGAYTVTVSDANDCSVTGLIEITTASALTYCDAWGQNNNFEWIESIQFGPLNNVSGNDDGYGDYTNIITELERGVTYTVLLEPGHVSTAYNEVWRIWIDWNIDGDFEDENELMFTSPAINIPVLVSLAIPGDVDAVTTRMRIAMRFGEAADPCGDFPYGEVEDYTIKILDANAYCDSEGTSTNYEWIESISIGNSTNLSENNNGYGDFTDLPIPAQAGELLPITLSPGHSGTPFNEFWSIWVDFNDDGEFSVEDETLFSSEGSNTTIDGFINIPADASPGPKRMRVSMKWGSSADPCEAFSWGEVEDYILEIYNEEGLIPDTGITLNDDMSGEGNDGGYESQEELGGKDPVFYPNPAQSFIILKHYSKIIDQMNVNIFDANGKQVLSQQFELEPGTNEYQIDIQQLSVGIYFVDIQQGQSQWQKKLVVVAQQ